MTPATALNERNRCFEIMELARRHGLADLGDAAITGGDSIAAFRTKLLSRLALRELGGTFSFRRALGCMSTAGLDGIEREVAQETAKAAGVPFDSHKMVMPWGLFQRDLTTETPGAAGYLVGAATDEALDVLRPWSVVARAGITIFERLSSSLLLPRTTSKAIAYWLANQATNITESTPATGQIAFEPKEAGAYIEFSRQFALQTRYAGEQYVRRELLRTVGSLVDQAVLSGSGAAGQPTGLLNTAGIGTQSGTSLSYTGVCDMKEAAATANAPDEAIAFLGTPAVRQLLEVRERATGSGFIWDDDRVASRPAHVTTDLPAATLIAGAWSELILGLWGPGVEFSVNPYAGFPQGIIGARVVVACDVAVAHAAAFTAASSIT